MTIKDPILEKLIAFSIAQHENIIADKAEQTRIKLDVGRLSGVERLTRFAIAEHEKSMESVQPYKAYIKNCGLTPEDLEVPTNAPKG